MFFMIEYMIVGDDNVKFLKWFIFKWNILFMAQCDSFWIMVIGEDNVKFFGMMYLQMTIFFMVEYHCRWKHESKCTIFNQCEIVGVG